MTVEGMPISTACGEHQQQRQENAPVNSVGSRRAADVCRDETSRKHSVDEEKRRINSPSAVPPTATV